METLESRLKLDHIQLKKILFKPKNCHPFLCLWEIIRAFDNFMPEIKIFGVYLLYVSSIVEIWEWINFMTYHDIGGAIENNGENTLKTTRTRPLYSFLYRNWKRLRHGSEGASSCRWPWKRIFWRGAQRRGQDCLFVSKRVLAIFFRVITTGSL